MLRDHAVLRDDRQPDCPDRSWIDQAEAEFFRTARAGDLNEHTLASFMKKWLAMCSNSEQIASLEKTVRLWIDLHITAQARQQQPERSAMQPRPPRRAGNDR